MSELGSPIQIEVWVQTAGLGHVTRELNFLKTLQQSETSHTFQFHFFCDENKAIQSQIAENGFSCTTLPNNLDNASQIVEERWRTDAPDIFILDTVDYDQNLSVKGLLENKQVLTCAVIDDPLNRIVDADIVLNPHPALSDSLPPVENKAQFLLGKDYFILAPEFAEYHARERFIDKECKNGFAFFGGLDGNDFTLDFLTAIEAGTTIRWKCLIGPLYEKRERALAVVREKQLPVEIVEAIPSVADALFQADIAVIAAGNTLVEAAAVGTPCMALSQNEIQDENAQYFVRTANLPALGMPQQFTTAQLNNAIADFAALPEKRRELSQRLKAQVDGLGGERVAQVLLARLFAI